jgi:L-lactate dehydrogenase complex protein LldG
LSGLAGEFERQLSTVGGQALRLRRAQVPDWLDGTIGDRAWVAWGSEEFEGTGAEAWIAARIGPRVAGRSGRDEFLRLAEAAEFGLTSASGGIAASGSVVLTAGRGRPRVTSLLPRRHLVLLPESKLVADLGAALRVVGLSALPSQLLFVTGPSRTSDIENDLTIGVHGPAEVRVVLVQD